MESEYLLHQPKTMKKNEEVEMRKQRKIKKSKSVTVRTPLEPGRCEEFSLLDNELYITLLSLSCLLMGPVNRLL